VEQLFMSDHNQAPSAKDIERCDACVLGRRAFLRDAGVIATSAFVALGMSPARAAAMPLELVSALGGTGDEKSYPIPATDGAQIDKKEQVIVARAEGKLYVFSLACPHQNTAIRWYEKEKQFECPKHHSKYRPDGTFIEGRATRGLDRFAVRKNGDMVVVDLDKLYEEKKDEEWKTAFIAL
jgi:nitrite reductase/ring-hydroxylating ferredoxin subunit